MKTISKKNQHVDVINTNASTLDSDIETVKSKYSVGKLHATLQTY